MKKQLSKCLLLYGSILLILKLYLTGLFPVALFMDWKTCSQSLLLLVFMFFDVKYLNFLICLRQMIFFRTKHYKLLIWLGGVIFSFLLICIDFLFLFPEFKYLVYLFFDLLFMCMFIGYQILTLSKNDIYHFYIGFALYLIANLTLNSFYSLF